MKFYKVTLDNSEEKPGYFGTKAKAHERAKDEYPSMRRLVRIELVEIGTDQETIAHILSGWGCGETVLKTWKVTERGGMVECPNGE